MLVRRLGKKDIYAGLLYPSSSQSKQSLKGVKSKNRYLQGSQINCLMSVSWRKCVSYFPEVLPLELPDLYDQPNSTESWQWFEEKVGIMCQKINKST